MKQLRIIMLILMGLVGLIRAADQEVMLIDEVTVEIDGRIFVVVCYKNSSVLYLVVDGKKHRVFSTSTLKEPQFLIDTYNDHKAYFNTVSIVPLESELVRLQRRLCERNPNGQPLRKK